MKTAILKGRDTSNTSFTVYASLGATNVAMARLDLLSTTYTTQNCPATVILLA